MIGPFRAIEPGGPSKTPCRLQLLSSPNQSLVPALSGARTFLVYREDRSTYVPAEHGCPNHRWKMQQSSHHHAGDYRKPSNVDRRHSGLSSKICFASSTVEMDSLQRPAKCLIVAVQFPKKTYFSSVNLNSSSGYQLSTGSLPCNIFELSGPISTARRPGTALTRRFSQPLDPFGTDPPISNTS